jgi:hypothetical protein
MRKRRAMRRSATWSGGTKEFGNLKGAMIEIEESSALVE